MTIVDIEKMSISERIKTMENLWDSLSKEASGIDSPIWHQEVLSSRQSKLDQGNAKFISIKELKQSI